MTDFFKDVLIALEGPYKWYAMVAALSFVSLIITKTMFKAVKWLFIVAFVIIMVLVIAKFSNIIQY